MTTPALHISAVSYDRDANGEVIVTYGEISRPDPAHDELLVRPEYIGICGTDIEILHGGMPETFHLNLPHTMGHEWSGIVVKVGDTVSGFSPGDRVLGHGDMGDNRWFGATHNGAASDLFVLPAAMCYLVPPELDMVTAAIIEPFACVLAGFQKIGGVTAADTVHVFGLGAIGLAAVAHAVHSGSTVVALDPSPLRRERALGFGAVAAFDPSADGFTPGEIIRLAGRPDADLVVEASGAASAQTAALEHAAPKGRVLYMGLSRPRPLPVRIALVVERDLTIRSSVGAPVEIWEPTIRYLARAKLDLRSMVTSTLPFSEASEAFARAEDPLTDIKVMLRPQATAN